MEMFEDGALSDEELLKMLSETLEVFFPEESIELGENWQIIARIFYELGKQVPQSAGL